MSDNMALLLEAERRGILPASKKALLDEARNRGLAPSNLDFSRSVADVRADIQKLPEGARKRALRDWADTVVAKERAERGALGTLDNAVRAVARGTFIGPFLDEVTAGSQAALHAASFGLAGAPFDETLAYQNAKDRAYDKANPATSVALRLAGGVAGGIAGMRTAASLPERAAGVAVAGPFPGVTPAATAPQRLGQWTGYGALHGAVAGAGEAEGGLESRIEGGIRGGGIGLFVGAGLGAGSETVRGVRNAYARQGVAGAYDQFERSLGMSLDDFADRIATGAGRNAQAVQRRTFDIIGEEMQRHGGDHLAARNAALQRIQAEFGVTLSTAQDNVRNLTRAHSDSPLMLGEYPAVAEGNFANRLRNPETLPLDEAGRSVPTQTQDMVDYLANTGGRAAAATRTAVTDRQSGLHDWFRSRLQAMAPEGQTLDQAEAMLAGVQQQARAAYGAAYNGPLNNRAALALPLLIRRHARRAAGRAGEAEDAIIRALREFEFRTSNGQTLNMMTLQHMQDARGAVRGMMERARRAGEDHIVAALQPLYRDVTRLMTRISPLWRQANDRYADFAQWSDVLEFAQRFPLRAGPAQRQALREFDRLAPEAQDLTRIAWLQQQIDRIDGLRDTHDVSKLFDKREVMNLVRRLFGGRDAVALARTIRDAEVAQRSLGMLGNSATHRRGVMQSTMDADLGIVAATENASRSGLRGWLTEKLLSVLRDRRNVPLSGIVTTPMADVFSVARHLHNARNAQQRLQRLQQISPNFLQTGRAVANVLGQSVAPDAY